MPNYEPTLYEVAWKLRLLIAQATDTQLENTMAVLNSQASATKFSSDYEPMVGIGLAFFAELKQRARFTKAQNLEEES